MKMAANKAVKLLVSKTVVRGFQVLKSLWTVETVFFTTKAGVYR